MHDLLPKVECTDATLEEEGAVLWMVVSHVLPVHEEGLDVIQLLQQTVHLQHRLPLDDGEELIVVRPAHRMLGQI